MSKIVLVRHGESEWNKKDIWTGWTDIPLSQKGKEEARLAAKKIKNIIFHLLFTSDLSRSWQTLEIIKEFLRLKHLPSVKHQALKERHYGEFTGKRKWDIQKKVGDLKFKSIRRGWNEPIIGGETLKDVFYRVVPYYQKTILPHIVSGKNVLLVSHGNTIRALIKHLEGISDKDISAVEIKTGDIIIYDVDNKGKIIRKKRINNTIT